MSISVLSSVPKLIPVRGAAPPTRAPPLSSNSPCKVTILPLPRCFLAFDNESMITVSPNTFPNASLYLGSNLTKSCAKPTAPDFFEINIAAALGLYECILFNGKNRTLPMLLRFKNSIASAAALSFSVTIDCNRAPAATSNAVAYSLSTLPNSATVPIIPDNLPSSRHCKIALTPLA